MIPDLRTPEPPYRFNSMPHGTNAIVRKFFEAERKAINDRKVLRKAERITALDANISFLNPMPYTWKDRNHYFRAILNYLQQREAGRCDVVLLDPCTGLSSFNQNPNDAHLDPNNLSEIWRALRPGDVLMVFQYQLQGDYARNWQNLARGVIAGAICMPIAGVRNRGLNNAVRFFCITKQ